MSKDPLTNMYRDVFNASETVWRDIEMTARRITEWLVLRGKMSADEARSILDDFGRSGRQIRQDWETHIDENIRQRIRKHLFPHREEMTDLRRRVTRLIERADRLEALWRERKGL